MTGSLTAASKDAAHSQYARSAGAPELVREISRVYSPRITPTGTGSVRFINPDSQVLVTVGASQAIYVACLAFLDVDDEAILIAPAFDIYSGAVTMAGAKAVYVPLRPRKGSNIVSSSADLVIDMKEFARKVSEKTKLLILNSPHNPTGKVFTREEYLEIVRILDEKAPECVVVSDEVYEHLVFDGEHVPFASVSESAFERTLSVYSAGKTFSATGLKIGWVIGTENLVRDLQIAHQYMVFAINAPAQVAVASALRTADEPFEGYENYYKWLCALYARKRDMLVSTLHEANMHPIKPQGAFYICTRVPDEHPAKEVAGLPDAIQNLVDERKLQIDPATKNRSDYNICRNMVLRYGVAAIPNSAFFTADHIDKAELARDYIRFAFCKPDQVLEQAKAKLCSTPR